MNSFFLVYAYGVVKVMSRISHQANDGFTIVELLIVIVVIAILATIGFVAYGNISKQAQNGAYRSDARGVLSKLNLFYSTYGTYPASSDTELNDPNSPMKLPDNVQIIYTDVVLNSMRNGITRNTTNYTPFQSIHE